MFNRGRNTKVSVTANHGVIIGGEHSGKIIIQSQGKPTESLSLRWENTPLASNDAALLHWRSRVPSQLFGRDKEFNDLRNWAESDHQLLIRVLYGEGGVGKTRLAFELADQLKDLGWNAGQVPDLTEGFNCELVEKGTLVIIDYPEEQSAAVADFFSSLHSAVIPEKRQLRILLLARNNAAANLVGKLVTNSDALALKPLDQQTVDSWSLFQAAYHRLAVLKEEEPSYPIDKTQFDKWVGLHATHKRPLLIIAFALHLTYKPDDTSVSSLGIIQAIIRRERNKLEQQASDQGFDPILISLLKAIATLKGGLSADQYDVLLEFDRDADKKKLNLPLRVELGKLSLLCQSSQDNNVMISAFEPDLLGSEWVLQLLADSELFSALSLEYWLPACLLLDPTTANEQGVRLGRIVNDANTLESQRQQDETVNLQNLLTVIKSTAQQNIELGFQLATLFDRDYIEESLKPLAALCSRQRVQRFETLSEQDFEQYAPDLAMSLNNLSNRLAETGDHDQALTVLKRAIELNHPFAKPGTVYAERQAIMQQRLDNWDKGSNPTKK